MPELPELQALSEGLKGACTGARIVGVHAWHPATLKTAMPPLTALVGSLITDVWRRGKLIGIEAGELTLVVHLMQSGRLGLAATGTRRPGKSVSLSVELGTEAELRVREASTEHRATVHVLDRQGLATHEPLVGLGPEPIGLAAGEWKARLSSPPGRLYTALRDGRRIAGIGRAYGSDIMWAARLAPFARTDRMSSEEFARLAAAADAVLGQALERARERITTNLPDREKRVTAVHKHYGDPCLRCGCKLERVSFEGYELVYCPDCQNGGRVLADRRMSRLLR